MDNAMVPKLIGADVELGNFFLGLERPGGTAYEASRALLAEIEGFPRTPSLEVFPPCAVGPRGYGHNTSLGSYSGCQDRLRENRRGSSYDSQDWGRKFLALNGGCAYVDLNHLELCTPEVGNSWNFTAAWHAMLRIARRALQAANDNQPPGRRIQVHVNNSDGQGNSYGSHLNFLITRRTWDNIFERKLHQLLFLASYQVSSIVFTGQGKVGSEHGEPETAFQLSQRADFFKTLVGTQTTFDRPIVNSRDEALCGRKPYLQSAASPASVDLARLHVIFFDSTLCHVSTLLKVGVMQILLAQIEREQVNPSLILDDPIDAVKRWSRDPALAWRARMASGKRLTAVELQMLFLEDAKKFAEQGGCEGVVPGAAEILALWEDTLRKLQAGDFASLAPRLDWVLKRRTLERALEQRPNLDWASPQIKHLDHLYSSLDESEGLYWACERAGAVEKVVSDSEIEWFTAHAPEDTRAWGRAMLLRRVGAEGIDEVDWDFIRFRFRDRGWFTCRRLEMADPLGFTRELAEPVFKREKHIDELVDALESLGTAEAAAVDAGSSGAALEQTQPQVGGHCYETP